MNPTHDVFEQRVALMEGGVGALATSSGQSAITYSILNIAEAGDEIIASSSLYGGTYALFAHTLTKLGIKFHLVDVDDPAQFQEKMNDKTKAVFIETIGNPRIILRIFKQLPILHMQIMFRLSLIIHLPPRIYAGQLSMAQILWFIQLPNLLAAMESLSAVLL